MFELNHETDTLLTIPRLQFILCQLENILLPKQRYSYNVITLTLTLKAQLISPACYIFFKLLNVLHFHIKVDNVILLQNRVWNMILENFSLNQRRSLLNNSVSSY